MTELVHNPNALGNQERQILQQIIITFETPSTYYTYTYINFRKYNIPLKTNSKNVFKLSGDGEVTKIFEYPKAIAPATAIPRAADLPRPLAAVNDTVYLRDFSDMASINFNTAFA